jgi:hypothetical protein
VAAQTDTVKVSCSTEHIYKWNWSFCFENRIFVPLKEGCGLSWRVS